MKKNECLNVVVVGHVDHGKSTVIGRLLADTNSLPEGVFNKIKTSSQDRGMQFEWAFLLDAFQAERDQGITIDSTQIWFKSSKRDYVIIDAPGHKEFLKNMMTGASRADAAILLIDACEGVQEQSRRHSYLLNLLGIKQVVVGVNKMDLCNYNKEKFYEVKKHILNYLDSIKIKPNFIIPLSAREGDGITRFSKNFSWYRGECLIDALDTLKLNLNLTKAPLRFPIQDIYKFDERRIISGRIESGSIKIGDDILFSPSNKTASIKSIETWNYEGKKESAQSGESVGITLDDQTFVERGEIVSHLYSPPIETDVFRARIFWFGHEKLNVGMKLLMKISTNEVEVYVQSIEKIISIDDLTETSAENVSRHQFAELVLRSRSLIAVDEGEKIFPTGRFGLIHNFKLVAGGLISMEGYADQRNVRKKVATNVTRVEHRVAVAERAKKNNHSPGIFWLTGLSGAGKSTIALEVERRLFDAGFQVYLLDGDNIRDGLNANLTFSPEDRSENIRRVGEVAALFARAGFVVLTAFISPYRSDRERARESAKDINFHEIYIESDLSTCEKRDPKGLYKKARAGEIKDFTGIDAPYENPENPNLVIDTQKNNSEICATILESYISVNLIKKPK